MEVTCAAILMPGYKQNLLAGMSMNSRSDNYFGTESFESPFYTSPCQCPFSYLLSYYSYILHVQYITPICPVSCLQFGKFYRIAFPLKFNLLTDVKLISQRRRRFQSNWIVSNIKLFDECVCCFDDIQRG